ncbi:MAG: PEP-CTERM sorting domain-containing protein [Pirellulales bacterium]|nr:PEP-CTERM sorting domain-containing protein [Pirellulales bacterium]
MNRILFLCVALAVGAMASIAQAEFLTNGNFEDPADWGALGAPGNDALPAGWTHVDPPDRMNPAVKQTGVNAIGGSGTSAYLPADFGAATEDRRDMWNVVSSFGYDWVLQYDFACEDPNTEVNADRSLSSAVELTNLNRIIHRITDLDNDGYGDFQIYDKTISNYRLIFGNSVQFDPDVSETPVVNHIKFTGHYDGSKQVYDVELTNGLGTFTATDLAYYHYLLSGTGSRAVTGAEGVSFNTFNSKADSLVDNVSLTVPEPGILLLLTCGTMCLVGMRRRG